MENFVTENNEANTVELNRDQIRSLERDAKLTREATARAEAAEKKLAMMGAGLDLSRPAVEFFATHYTGELTVEALTAEALRLGLISATDSNAEKPETPPATGITNARELLANGAVGDNGQEPTISVKKSAVKEALKLVQDGASMDDAQALLFNRLVEAASKGDKSVIVEGIRS